MAKYELVHTRHAKARMKERGISAEEVISAMDHPDDVIVGKKGELNAFKTVGEGKRIRVVYVKEKNQRIVITAMIIDKNDEMIIREEKR